MLLKALLGRFGHAIISCGLFVQALHVLIAHVLLAAYVPAHLVLRDASGTCASE